MEGAGASRTPRPLPAEPAPSDDVTDGGAARRDWRKDWRNDGDVEGVERKSLSSPDARRTFLDQSERVAVRLGAVVIGRGVYRSGWRWSEHVRPLSDSDSGEHIGYVISGRMAVRAKDGTEVEIGPGDAFIVGPGHDAWVLGDEPCVAVDFAATGFG
jgi:cupin domain